MELWYEFSRIMPDRLEVAKDISSATTARGVTKSGMWLQEEDFARLGVGSAYNPGVPMELHEIDGIVHTHRHDPTLLGNRIEAWAKKIGADKAAKLWTKWTNIPCDCEWRRDLLNDLHKRARGLMGAVA